MLLQEMVVLTDTFKEDVIKPDSGNQRVHIPWNIVQVWASGLNTYIILGFQFICLIYLKMTQFIAD